MIKSMTGFGKASLKAGAGTVIAEIKTVNHKFFDATLKIPETVSVFEEKIKELLQRRIKRGKVNLNIICNGSGSKYEKVEINKAAAKNYYKKILTMKNHLGLKEEIKLSDILALPGVLDYDVVGKSIASLWPKIKKAIESAVDKLVKERKLEGRAIYKDLSKRAKRIGSMLSVIESRAHLNIGEYRRRFADRVKDLAGGRDVDMGRLEMEVAIYAKNSDIAEEITRLKNHISNLKKTLSESGEAGKKIDFIAQELHREINTAGSKVSDFKISKSVIDIKSEIEKIREQAKNIE